MPEQQTSSCSRSGHAAAGAVLWLFDIMTVKRDAGQDFSLTA
jgi:hypothetical protein